LRLLIRIQIFTNIYNCVTDKLKYLLPLRSCKLFWFFLLCPNTTSSRTEWLFRFRPAFFG